MIFENPQNGYKEEVSRLTWLWCFLFGGFYLMYKGLWAHVFIFFGVIVGLAIITGGPGAMVAPILWIAYAITTPGILKSKYLRMGWKLVETGAQS
jgi:hypothetical protein